MKIVGICGSPREGASEYLLKRALNELEKEDSFETTFISVKDKDISPCTHCNECAETKGKCSISDDMDEIYKALKESDGIIMASPIHFGSISAQLKAVIDRCQAMIMEDLDIQLAIIKQLSRQELHSTAGYCQADDRQESCSSAGNCQADEQTLITQLSRPGSRD